MQATNHALKEWRVAVEALEQGETIVLLRKGGIREAGGKFAIAHAQVLLYPTDEHQRPHWLKAPYASRVEFVPSGWHPSTVPITAWASITDVLPMDGTDRLAALLPFHIWNEDFVAERLRWKPDQPLHVLLLRVYRLRQPRTLDFIPAYGGCKSWIELAEAIVIADSTPVLSDQAYAERVAAVRGVVGKGEG